MCRGEWHPKARPWLRSALTDSDSSDLLVFWGFSAFASACLGVLEIVGQGRALSALDALCSHTDCGNLYILTKWIIAEQIVVCAAVLAYVLSCVCLLSHPVTGYRLAVCLLLALVSCAFQLIAAIGQFTNSEWVTGLEGENLDAERLKLVIGLCWCLAVVFVLMVLLVCADHAQHLASNQILSPRYLSQSIMAQIEAHRPKRCRQRGRREPRLLRSWHGVGRELYPILEAEAEGDGEEAQEEGAPCHVCA